MTIKINSLELENVKRIKAVKVEPNQNGLTVIGGRNNQGKTSVLDSIAWALGGNKFKPSNAAREGSTVPPNLNITLSNGLVVERKGKNSALKITDPNGNKAGQQILNGFIEELALDLPKFMEASNKEKANILLRIIGVGGNEVEWMTIGAVPNIMDNLIADSLTKEAIVVTMDNTYFNWDYDRIINNLFNNILPYIETHYNVSKEVNDRAFCGLSMGSMTTTTLYQTHPDQFGYFGCFSGANVPVDVSKVAHLDQPNLYITAGCIDMALMNDSYNTASDRTTTGFVDKLNTLNLTNYKLEILNGAHDWYVWRESFTNFVKDHLWTKDVKIETPSETPVIKPETPASSTNTTTAPKTSDDLNLAVAGLFIIISVTTGVVIKKHY